MKAVHIVAARDLLHAAYHAADSAFALLDETADEVVVLLVDGARAQAWAAYLKMAHEVDLDLATSSPTSNTRST